MPKSHPEYERGFTDGFNSRQRDVEQFDALRKAAEDALTALSYPRFKDTATLMEKIAEELERKAGDGWTSYSAPHLRRAANNVRDAHTALRKALGKEQ